MTARRQTDPGPTARLRPVAADIAAAVRRAGLTHAACASFLGKERSLITKQLNGASPIDGDDLEGWMDLTDSIRPVQKMMLRLGYEIVPLEREAQPTRVRSAFFRLMQDTGAACSEADEALEDGEVDEVEAAAMMERLQGLIDQLHDLKSSIPTPRPRRVAGRRR